MLSKFSFKVFNKSCESPKLSLDYIISVSFHRICRCLSALSQHVCPKTALCVCQTSSHRLTWQTRGWPGRWWRASWLPSASWRRPSSSAHWQPASSTSSGGANSRGDEVRGALTVIPVTFRPVIYTGTCCTAHQIHTHTHYKLCTEPNPCGQWKCCGMRCAVGSQDRNRSEL